MTVAGKARILLVDDSATDGELALRALRRADSRSFVLWVRDGEEALEYLFKTGRYADNDDLPPKVVLLDIKMPKVDGLEVLRQFRERDPERTVPIVMLTSSAEDRDLRRSYALGANSYVVKATDYTQLFNDVSRVSLYWIGTNRTPGDLRDRWVLGG